MSPRSPLIGVVAVLAGLIGLLAAPAIALGADHGRIAGRVVGGPDAAVLADAAVDLHRSVPGGWQQVSAVTTDANGRYRFGAIDPGRYRVCATPYEGIDPAHPDAAYLRRCWRNAATVDTADDIELAAGAVVGGVTIRLPARGRIRGHVTDTSGTPVTGGYAQVFWKEQSGHWQPGPYSYFDGSGGYDLRLAGPRVYHVCFTPWDDRGLAVQCWNGVPALPSSTGIPAGAPNQTVDGIDAQLDVAGQISGLISGYPNGTQGSIEILAYRKDGGEWWQTGWSTVEPWTSPNPYEIFSLPAGHYRVCFSSQDFEFFPVFARECVGGTPTVETATDMEVVAGETTSGADVEVGSASRIRGRVNGISAPVPVQLLTESGEPIFERLTEANGTFGFAELPDGTYKVAFNRVPGETRLGARFYRNVSEQAGAASATEIHLGMGDTASGITSQLPVGGSITGRVVDHAGVGIEGCQVRAYTPDGSLVTRWSETDGAGSFDVGGLTTGTYRLLISGGTCGIGQADLHYDAGTPTQLTEDASLADPLAVVVGHARAVAGDLVIAELRDTERPSIAGTPRTGEPLNADPGSWSPADVTFAYQWYADGVLLPGATGPSYTPGVDQVGTRIRVRVTASKAGYADASRLSAPTAPVTTPGARAD